MTQEFEARIVFEPKSFVETFGHLLDTLNEHASHKTNDSVAKYLRNIRHEHALDILSEANEAHGRKQFDAAWYCLVEVAQDIGFLVASQGATYPRGDEDGLYESLAKNGKKGGTQKGVNAKALQDRIVAMLLEATPKNGWKSKDALRRKYNEVTAEIDGYKDADRKWRELLKRDDIQESLKKQSKE